MAEVFLEKFSLLRLAKGLRARGEKLSEGASVNEANVAFKEIHFIDYELVFESETIRTLEDYPNLNNLLIDLLEMDEHLKHLTGEEYLIALEERRELNKNYELVHRMTAADVKSLSNF